ncbi:MAG TPA: hypothetical protein VL326_03240 [Kofleriaceae bacterium]|jgi:histone H3/H4|nr:hypothetical protein [Kofleriaceae bacterium]
MADPWKKCTACKNPIPFNATHWVCSVSTCTRRVTDYVFCTVPCWDSHVAELRHRDAWAVEKRAPSKDEWDRELAANPPPAPAAPPKPATPAAPVVRRIVGKESSGPIAVPAGASASSSAAAASGSGGAALQLADTEREILIVVSKMKKYIKDRSGFNCSDAVAEFLSDHVRAVCDDAIRNAAKDERKTVLDRDVPRPVRR